MGSKGTLNSPLSLTKESCSNYYITDKPRTYIEVFETLLIDKFIHYRTSICLRAQFITTLNNFNFMCKQNLNVHTLNMAQQHYLYVLKRSSDLYIQIFIALVYKFRTTYNHKNISIIDTQL